MSSRNIPALHAGINEDGSCLIEWYFAKFHIGISLEANAKESYYFIVIVDDESGNMDTATRRINGELAQAADRIVQFVLRNA